MQQLNATSNTVRNLTILVAALGYFVDIYDLLLFSIVRVPSLKGLGYDGELLTDKGLMLLNVQMVGMLLGGIVWGMLGDKKGRLSVLFGSILLYSIGNIGNGFVHSIEAYAFWRFVAGFGLAGELGAGITLVAEIMPKEKRGYATTIVAAVGISGAVAAYFIANYFNDWRMSYFIGGGLGLLLLLLRVGISESGIFKQSKQSEVPHGNFIGLLSNTRTLGLYLRCILIGIPLWFVVGILITLSPEFAKVLHVQGEVSAGAAVACCYGGIVLGDIASGLLSQALKSRLKVVLIFLLMGVASVSTFFMVDGVSSQTFYWVTIFVGFTVGYWVIFMTNATEQFGTNIRATVTTTVPNFVRGSVVPITFLFQFLKGVFDGSILSSGIAVAIFCFAIAFWSLSGLKDTFTRDLNFVEDL